MFAAGRAATTGSIGTQDADGNQTPTLKDDSEDWLRARRIGKNDDAANTHIDKANRKERVTGDFSSSVTTLQVYKGSKKAKKRKDKSSKKDKKKKKKRSRRDSDDDSDRTSDNANEVAIVQQNKHTKKELKRAAAKPRRYSDSSTSESSADDIRSRKRRRPESHRRSRICERSESSTLVSVWRGDGDGKELSLSVRGTRDEGRSLVSTEKLFEFDCVGDQNNTVYGGLYAHDIPLYSVATRRNLLTGEWINVKRKDGLSRTADGGYNRYYSSAARKMERDARQRRLYLAYSEKRLSREKQRQMSERDSSIRPSELSFIPVDPVLDFDDDDRQQYNGNEQPDNATIAQTDTQSVEQYMVSRSKDFNAKVAANPHDIGTWLDFIVFQEQSLRLTNNSKSAPAAKASIMDRQATILEKAITCNPQSRELRLVKLNMALQSNSNNDTIRQQLEDLVENDPTNCDVWIKLVQCRQQNFTSFSMQSLRDLYARIISILAREIAKESVKPEQTTIASAPSAQIFKNDSILAAPDGSRAFEGVSDKSRQLGQSLIDFHWLMCTVEEKSGYFERAIAQVQALLDVNINAQPGSAQTTFSELLQLFSARWNQEIVLFGENVLSEQSVYYTERSYIPSEIEFHDSLCKDIVSDLEKMNPPEVIRDPEHNQRLLRSSGLYQRSKSFSANRVNDAYVNQQESIANTVEEERTPEGTLVYSNLHGYRIRIDQSNDADEYERILSELRGTERSIARQEAEQLKEQKRQTVLSAVISRLRDERQDYEPIKRQDSFVHWLEKEELRQQVQWMPLRSTNPSHQEMIEEEPDRAVLSDEIQPFLFPVLEMFHHHMVLNLLQLVGVRLVNFCRIDVYSFGQTIYADGLDEYGVLVNPIVNAMDPASNESLILSPSNRRNMLQDELLQDVRVHKLSAHDPAKVNFVRNVFVKSVNTFHSANNEDFLKMLKSAWIGFEAQVALQNGCSTKATEEARASCQRILHQTGNDENVLDMYLMCAYAKLELQLGNVRQMNRVCDKTLSSLQLHSCYKDEQSRDFHRLIFLRARQEIWASDTSPESGMRRLDQVENLHVLRGLYILWSVWDPSCDPLNELAKKYRKNPRGLHEHLLNVLPKNTQQEVITTYCRELNIALQQCQMHETPKTHDYHESFCSVGYCLHNYCLVIYATSGFQAACHEYQSFLRQVKVCQRRWIWLCYLEFMQQHHALRRFPSLSPREWRKAIGTAVELFPCDPLLLRLFIDAETGNTMSQTLRRYFFDVQRRWQRHFDSPALPEWLFAVLCEFYRIERATMHGQSSDNGTERPTCCMMHRWGLNRTAFDRIQHVFENMVHQLQTRGNALCWRLYLRFEVALGKIDAAKKIFYRGIASCPWSKALYLDGIRVLRPYLSEAECIEILEFMTAKEIYMRVDIEDI